MTGRTRNQDQALPQVVYILGAGRSGSTLLGILLGNLPGVFYGGELVAWNHFRGEPLTERPDVLELWDAIARRVEDRADHHATDFFPLLEHHRSLLRPDRLLDRDLIARYEDQNRALLAAIGAETGCTVVVDSSHFPQRAWRLRRMPGVDLRIVHLVRDPRDVVAALQKPVQRKAPMRPLQANAYCLLVALHSWLVLRTVPARRRMTLRYEDLVDDPRSTVRRLGRFVGADPSEVDPDDLEVGPLFQGNRIRHLERLTIRPTEGGRPLPVWLHRATTVVQMPTLAAYGYLRGRPRRRRREAVTSPGSSAGGPDGRATASPGRVRCAADPAAR